MTMGSIVMDHESFLFFLQTPTFFPPYYFFFIEREREYCGYVTWSSAEATVMAGGMHVSCEESEGMARAQPAMEAASWEANSSSSVPAGRLVRVRSRTMSIVGGWEPAGIYWKKRGSNCSKRIIFSLWRQLGNEIRAQRGCVASVIGGFQDPAGHKQETSWDPFQPKLYSDATTLYSAEL